MRLMFTSTKYTYGNNGEMFSNSRPLVMDPANPLNNVCSRFDWEDIRFSNITIPLRFDWHVNAQAYNIAIDNDVLVCYGSRKRACLTYVTVSGNECYLGASPCNHVFRSYYTHVHVRVKTLNANMELSRV